jgi:hypothetical protein
MDVGGQQLIRDNNIKTIAGKPTKRKRIDQEISPEK